MAEKLALKVSRMSGGMTLVQVAAEGGCSIGLVQKYELCPEALTNQAQRRKLDEIYSRFTRSVAA